MKVSIRPMYSKQIFSSLLGAYLFKQVSFIKIISYVLFKLYLINKNNKLLGIKVHRFYMQASDQTTGTTLALAHVLLSSYRSKVC